MHRRQITLADGRYLIFYTFDAEPAPPTAPPPQQPAAPAPAPQPRPVAEEERRV